MIISFIGIYVYINETRLFIITIWLVLLSPKLAEINGIFAYIPYALYILLIIKIFEKKFIAKEKIFINKYLGFTTLGLLLINAVSLIYNNYDTNIILLTFTFLKKFSYIIFYIFFTNMNVEKKYININMKLILVYSLIQFPLIIFQFISNTNRDNISGLFGKSGTGILIQIFLYILVLIIVNKENFIKIKNFQFVFVSLLLMYSALAEVKIGFILIPLIYLMTIFLKKGSFRTILAILIIGLLISVSYKSFIKFYPDQNLFGSSEEFVDYAKNAYGVDSVNRFGFMNLLKSTVLTNKFKMYFGTGLGTTNPSNINILAGEVAIEYDYLNLHFFTLPLSIVENGIIGTIMWISIYIYILAKNVYMYFKKRTDKSIINIMSIIITVIFIIYNSSIISSSIIILILWLILVVNNEIDD